MSIIDWLRKPKPTVDQPKPVTDQPKPDAAKRYVELATTYPFLKKLYELSQIAVERGNVWASSNEKPSGIIAVVKSDPDTATGFLVDFRSDPVTAPQPSATTKQETTTLEVNRPPHKDDTGTIKSIAMTVTVNNFGQLEYLVTTKEHWQEVMGSQTQFPANSRDFVPGDLYDRQVLVDQTCELSQLDTKVVEYISKTVDQAHQAFGLNVPSPPPLSLSPSAFS